MNKQSLEEVVNRVIAFSPTNVALGESIPKDILEWIKNGGVEKCETCGGTGLIPCASLGRRTYATCIQCEGRSFIVMVKRHD